MKNFKFYDDIAKQMVTIEAKDFYEALLVIKKEHGPAHIKHMHAQYEDNNNYRVFGSAHMGHPIHF
jgi:hypothetical protein